MSVGCCFRRISNSLTANSSRLRLASLARATLAGSRPLASASLRGLLLGLLEDPQVRVAELLARGPFLADLERLL